MALPTAPAVRSLGVEDVGVLVGVLVDDGLVLADELADRVVDVERLGPGHVPLHAVVDVDPGDVVLVRLQQGVLDDVLDLVDLHLAVEPRGELPDDLLHEVVEHQLVQGTELAVHLDEGLGDGGADAGRVEREGAAVPLADRERGFLEGERHRLPGPVQLGRRHLRRSPPVPPPHYI
jgi:hypothetical protein